MGYDRAYDLQYFKEKPSFVFSFAIGDNFRLRSHLFLVMPNGFMIRPKMHSLWDNFPTWNHQQHYLASSGPIMDLSLYTSSFIFKLQSRFRVNSLKHFKYIFIPTLYYLLSILFNKNCNIKCVGHLAFALVDLSFGSGLSHFTNSLV